MSKNSNQTKNPINTVSINVYGVLLRFFNGAGEGNRTPDLLITSQLLYQLSYTGVTIVQEGVWKRSILDGWPGKQPEGAGMAT